MEFKPVESLEVFKHFEGVAGWAWDTVNTWKPFEQQTLGKQLVRAADSIGANMVEGEGRQSAQDSIRFLRIALGSAKETRLWIQRARDRGLIEEFEAERRLDELNLGLKKLNALIQFRIGKLGVRESVAEYLSDL